MTRRILRFPRGCILLSSIVRKEEPKYLGSAEAHMQPYARCVVVPPCATDGVLELLPRQQHIRSSPACSLLTRSMCICKRWVRLMTAREPPHSDLSVTCFARPQSSRCISPRGVAQIPAACTTRLSLSLCASSCGGTDGTRPKCEPLTSYGYDHQLWPPRKIVIKENVQSCIQVQCFNIIQFPSCMRESRREGTLQVSGHASQPHSGSPPIDIVHVRALRPYTSLFCRSSIP